MTVELVAKTIPTINGVDTKDFAAYVARIGKVKDDPDRLMKYLIKHSHWSPLEHTYFTYKIRTSRAIGRELLRHRSFTFQELSQRYEKVLEFEPIELRQQADKNRQSSEDVFDPNILDYYSSTTDKFGDIRLEPNFLKASEVILDRLSEIKRIYEELIEVGVARECARMILPECTSTTILMTGNLRSWFHFMSLRDHADAQKEAQIVARAIKESLAEEVPLLFKQ